MSDRATVVVARTGSPYFVGDDGVSANGEADTQCVIDHLADAGYNVVYFGLCNGEERLRKDVILMKPNMKGVDENATEDELKERLDPLIAHLQELRPICCVNVAGAPASWSWPKNPNGAFTQAFAVRYSAPCLYMIHRCGLPRVCVITDPKVYQRDCEGATMWPQVQPIAVLSQEETTFAKRIQDKKYKVVAKYAGCEYWRTEGMQRILRIYTAIKNRTITTAAHSHYGRGALGVGRDDVWPLILDKYLSDENEAGHCLSTRICGKMWEGHPTQRKYPEVFVGCLENERKVHELLREGYCGPMIPQKKGFNTTKIRLHALNLNAPLPYGRGGPYTYDADARVVPLDSPFRIDEDPDGLKKAVDYTMTHGDARLEYVNDVLEKTKPNWWLLDECVARLTDMEWRADAIKQNLEWVNLFGGYVPQ